MFLKFQQYLRDDTMIKAMPLVIIDGISHSCKIIQSLSYQLFFELFNYFNSFILSASVTFRIFVSHMDQKTFPCV